MSTCGTPGYLALVWALSVGPALAAQPMPHTVTVITDHAHPVSEISALKAQGIHVRVLDLDAPRRLMADINRGLPDEPKAAAAVARKRMHALNARRVKHAYAALQTALADQIKHYPTVIFDQHAIVLGVTDLKKALAHYLQWHSKARTGGHR